MINSRVTFQLKRALSRYEPRTDGFGTDVAESSLHRAACASVIQTRLKKKKLRSVRSEAAHEAEKRDERERKR